MIRALTKFLYSLFTAICYIALIVVIVFAAGVFLYSPEGRKSTNNKARVNNDLKIVMAQDEVKKALLEPSSARFEGSYVSNLGAVCGTVYAKNGFGGITKNFFVHLYGKTDFFQRPIKTELCD